MDQPFGSDHHLATNTGTQLVGQVKLSPIRAADPNRGRAPRLHDVAQRLMLLQVLARIGEVLDVTVGHLLYENAERRPLTGPDARIAGQLADIAQLDPDDQAALLNVLDALVTKTKLRALTGTTG